MPIFSRRNVKRMLDENRAFLTPKQMREHEKHLDGPDPVRRVTSEWEVAVLNGLRKFGDVEHEPKFSGASRIDALFTHETGTALIEITTVSDRGPDAKNPVDLLARELIDRLRRQGFNPDRFGLEVMGNPQIYLGGPTPNLGLPPPDDFGSSIFNEDFSRFLNEIRQASAIRREAALGPTAARVKVTYDPAATRFYLNHLVYTVTVKVDDDSPIYHRLCDKAEQFRKANFAGLKGIVLCDAGCASLKTQGRRGFHLGVGEIISAFLADHPSIAFVIVLLVAGDGSHYFGPDHLKVRSTTYLLPLHTNATSLANFLQRHLADALPRPETAPINAYTLSNEGGSFYGGFQMAGRKIKISARAVLGVLAGQIKQEDFVRDHPRFGHLLQQGRLLDAVKIEHVPERDDDWIEFTFSDVDPAISPYRTSKS